MAIVEISPSGFTISVHPDADMVRVAPAGELDMATADLLHDEVADLRRTGIEHVDLDLRGVSFMDGQGLSTLVVLRNAARRAGHRLTLVPGPRPVERVFALTRTRALFDWA
jgi:anti-anti-sigma factor